MVAPIGTVMKYLPVMALAEMVFCAHASHVHHMCITCVLHVRHMCITCVLHVYRMCITCVSFIAMCVCTIDKH